MFADLDTQGADLIVAAPLDFADLRRVVLRVTLYLMHQQSCRLLMHEWVKRRDRDQKYGAAPWSDTEAKMFNACRRPKLHGRASVINPRPLAYAQSLQTAASK